MVAKEALVAANDQRIAELEELLQLALHKRFGASVEKANVDQLQLLNEAEALSDGSVDEPASEETLEELDIVPPKVQVLRHVR